MSDSKEYKETFYIVPRYIRKLPGMTLAFLDVYETIYQFWNKGLVCFLSNTAIMERTDTKITQVKDAIAFFEKKGLLIRQKKGLKRFLIQPQNRIEFEQEAAPPAPSTDNTQVAAPAATGGRSSGHQVAAPAATEYKEVEYKEKKEILHIHSARESAQKFRKIDGTDSETAIKSLPLKSPEKEMLDPNYEYPDVLYPKKELAPLPDTIAMNLTIEQQNTFDKFWNLYPRKSGKARARTQWFHDGCHLIADLILEKLKAQIQKDKAFLEGFVSNPQKYIFEKRYEDEIFEGKPSVQVAASKSSDWVKTMGDNPFDLISYYGPRGNKLLGLKK